MNPCGLKTAPNTFQRILNTIFADYLHQWLTVYVDDIIMWAHTYCDALHTYELLFARWHSVQTCEKWESVISFVTIYQTCPPGPSISVSS